MMLKEFRIRRWIKFSSLIIKAEKKTKWRQFCIIIRDYTKQEIISNRKHQKCLNVLYFSKCWIWRSINMVKGIVSVGITFLIFKVKALNRIRDIRHNPLMLASPSSSHGKHWSRDFCTENRFSPKTLLCADRQPLPINSFIAQNVTNLLSSDLILNNMPFSFRILHLHNKLSI